MSSNASMAAAAFRISSQQERIWLEHERGLPQFAQCAIRINGALDLVRLESALEQIVGRYEILRTLLRRQGGVKLPFQFIQDGAKVSLTEVPPHGFEQGLRFPSSDVADGDAPALRASVSAGTRDTHRLILRLPAFCADSATLRNFFDELAAEYGTSQAIEVMQYADLVEWQNELLSSDETKPGRDYWREVCRKIDFDWLNGLRLPLERRSTEQIAVRSIDRLVCGLSDSLQNAAAQLNTSSEMLLLSAWFACLSKLLGRSELVVGCEFDGRRYQELRTAFGPLARCLPLRHEIKPETSFADLVRQLAAEATEAGNWQESFSWTQITGSEGPVLPFAFSFLELGKEKKVGDLCFTLDAVQVVSERFKLRLNVVVRGSDVGFEFDYDASRFDLSAIERIAGYYENLLRSALVNPGTAVSHLPLLTPAEREHLVAGSNQTSAPYPGEKCLHQLFELEAAKNPARMAVRCGEEALSYRQLNEASNQLAHYLCRQGVGPDHRVGVCLERSTAMMVAVLGILKAGGAYVPLNADNPRARLKQQLEGATALITEQKFTAQMPEFSGPTLVLDRDQKLWAGEAKSNPEVHTTAENLVYVIYTSGSTGVPKGVAVRHRNLVNYADFITQKLKLRNRPEGLQFATVSTLGADLGNTCIYPSLISGGTLHVIPYETSTDARGLAQYWSRYPVDVLKIVPSHLQALLQTEEAGRLLPRKYLIMGGEALTPKLLEKITSLNPTCEILNHYGPTETTIGSLTLELKDYDWRRSELSTIPIGRPIQNTQVYVLDQNLEPVAVGVTGELYIAGAGVTAGYLGQPEKTAERFLKNPFSADRDAKMYRTGDLARYTEDGVIEFLGRGDDQVKVRGFRIELGEIEAVLAGHAAVKQAVVLARSSDPGDAASEKRLLAYVVLHRDSSGDGARNSSDDLRHHLQQHLPDYMVPQAVVILPKLPLNPNGKLDRQALPDPEQVRHKTYVAPRTSSEQTIAEIWAEVLRRDKNQISADDNFFDLGGHSLLATQVASRLRRALNTDIPLRTLFECPTVEMLAAQATKLAASSQPQLPPIVRVPRDQPLPLSFAQQRLWVLDRMEPNNPLYNIPRAMRLTGALNTASLIDALNEIIRRHESQRTTFRTGPEGPVQVIAESLKLNVPVVDLTARPKAERENAAREIANKEAGTPFDLSRGPLLRATILKIDAQDHVLLLTMHHIVSDAWSSAVFFRELGEIYVALSQGKPSPLAELEIQYADYAAWQRMVLKGAVLENQLSYWREHLRGAPPLLELPTDRPRPPARTFAGAYEAIPFSSNIADAVKEFSQQHGVTPFMTMLAAFQALLARYSGQPRIVLGTDIANRTTAETERVIGFFINLLPLQTDVSGDPTFRELVERVRSVALGAYAHQDVPFDKVVEDLQPERSPSHNPIVQALFVMQNIPAQRRELPGVELSLFPIPIKHSKFDVAVFIRGSGGQTFQDWLYSTELFDRSTILRLAGNYETLLEHALGKPSTRLSELEIYREEDKKRLEKEKHERRRSQRSKLLAAEPKTVGPPAPEEGEK